jgi:hypothetical protein
MPLHDVQIGIGMSTADEKNYRLIPREETSRKNQGKGEDCCLGLCAGAILPVPALQPEWSPGPVKGLRYSLAGQGSLRYPPMLDRNARAHVSNLSKAWLVL